MIDDDLEKVYPFGINIYLEKGKIKTHMTEAVKSVVFAAFPDLDDRRDAVLTERFSRLLRLKAALDNHELFTNLNMDFYEAIQESGNDDLISMFTVKNVAIFHSSIRILTTNTIDMLLESADIDERIKLVGLMGEHVRGELLPEASHDDDDHRDGYDDGFGDDFGDDFGEDNDDDLLGHSLLNASVKPTLH